MIVLWISGSRVLGGAEHATLTVLRELRGRGHRVDVLCRGDGPLAPAVAAAGCTRLAAEPTWRGLRGSLRDRPPDGVLVTSIGDWLAACLAKPAAPNARLVLVRHMALPVSLPLRWLAGWRADAVVAVSAAVRERLAVWPGIPARRLRVIPNPSRFPVRDAVPSPDQRRAARARLGLPEQAKWVAYLGGAVAAKGPADALAAVRRADAASGPVRLLACGAGDRSTAPWREATALVRDLGRIEPVDEVLRAADALLVPTHLRLSEAMPLAVIEAMACGTPVVAYAVGGIPETLAGCGCLVEPENVDRLAAALIGVLGDADAAAAMAHRALARAAVVFDPARIADQYEAALFAARPRPGAG